MSDKNKNLTVNRDALPTGLVNGDDLLKILFPLESSRPCLSMMRSSGLNGATRG